jgi:galactokinase
VLDASEARRAFVEMFGSAPRCFRAPGRVNLIGEHTDFNEGFVLPMAIEHSTVAAAAPRTDRRVRVYSLNLHETAEFDLDHPGAPRRGVWLDYVEGVAQALEARGMSLRGVDLVVQSDVPAGAGLSSSAALEMATGLALLTVSGAELDMVSLALAGQQAEHVYVGMMCGIMDQFIAALGRPGHALLIDCRTLEATPIPLDTSDTRVVICDTHVKHELASSGYNARRAECERGVVLLNGALPGVRALRDVSVEDFERHEGLLPEQVRRRCRHVITENARTLAAARALRANDAAEVGRLMYLSHRSLRDDFEVSCAELDVLVEAASGVEGVWGARMTGGGFGGCTVNLVRREALDNFQNTVARRYHQATQREPAFYVSEPRGGAHEIRTPSLKDDDERRQSEARR